MTSILLYKRLSRKLVLTQVYTGQGKLVYHHTPWLAAIKEQNAQLVTGRGSPTDYSTTKSGEETRQTTVGPTTTVSWEETSGSKGKQEMVLSITNQLKPGGAFVDSSELVVVQSPLATLLVTVEEEKAELVTKRQRGRAP